MGKSKLWDNKKLFLKDEEAIELVVLLRDWDKKLWFGFSLALRVDTRDISIYEYSPCRMLIKKSTRDEFCLTSIAFILIFF